MSCAAERIESVEGRRLHSGTPAQAACFSLPVPPGVDSVEIPGLPGGGVPIAWWNPRMLKRLGWESGNAPCPDSEAPNPRRLLMTVASDDELPHSLGFKTNSAESGQAWEGPEWSVGITDRFVRGTNFWEEGELALRFKDRQTALRVGLKHRSDGLLWWQWLRAEELWRTPACKAIRCAGYIPHANQKTPEIPDLPDKEARSGYWRDKKASGALHSDWWILGEAYVLLFANGVIHVTARHVNNHLYNRWGHDLENVLPVIAIRSAIGGEVELAGEAVELDLGAVRLNTEECRSLASPEHPGRIYQSEDLAVMQPYDCISVPIDSIVSSLGEGETCEADVGDPDRWLFPNGVARSVRFCLSMGEAPARVERYVLPYWWYGLMAEMTPNSYLPVRDEQDSAVDFGTWGLINRQRRGCFDDGAVLRYSSKNEDGWEGETPYNLIRSFYRDPGVDLWERSLSNTYHIADIAVYHIDFIMRMHGYESHAIAPPMNRSNGLLQGYLETGDPYLLETCENLAMASAALDSSNWPRRSYGRDAMFIRGLILLDDYLPGRGHAVRAREALGRLMQCLRPDGCVSQQSGTVGSLHGTVNENVCVWQNFHILEPVMDWLERYPEDEKLTGFFRTICEWLASVFVREGDYGYWPNSMSSGDNERHAINKQPFPNGTLGIPYAAKSMLMASMLFEDPKYLQMWERNLKWYRKQGALPPPASQCERSDIERSTSDHVMNKSCESILWHQINRWRARWVDGEVQVAPYVLPDEELCATIVTPAGFQKMRMEGKRVPRSR